VSRLRQRKDTLCDRGREWGRDGGEGDPRMTNSAKHMRDTWAGRLPTHHLCCSFVHVLATWYSTKSLFLLSNCYNRRREPPFANHLFQPIRRHFNSLSLSLPLSPSFPFPPFSLSLSLLPSFSFSLCRPLSLSLSLIDALKTHSNLSHRWNAILDIRYYYQFPLHDIQRMLYILLFLIDTLHWASKLDSFSFWNFIDVYMKQT